MDFLGKILFLLLFEITAIGYISTEDGVIWPDENNIDNKLFSKMPGEEVNDIWLDDSFDDENDRFLRVPRQYPECAYDSDEIEIRNKSCKTRTYVLKELEFKWKSSYDCYIYLQPSLRNLSASPVKPHGCVFRNKMLVTCLFINSTSPNSEKCFQVDENIEEVRREIRRTLISDRGLRKWVECSKNAMRCCENVLADSIPENDTCPAVWDAWSCWDKAPAGTTSTGVCPEYAYSNTGPACHHFSSKVCQDNGTWIEKTDYGSCSVTQRLITRVNFHISCLSISLIVALPAVTLLFAYNKLRVRRLALHRNLLIAIMIRNILVIITKSTIIMEQLKSSSNDTIMSRNEWPCKMLASLDKLAASAAFTCMLIDGIFLHRMIVAVFKRELNIFMIHGIGAAVTIIPVIVWIILMSTMNDSDCWIVYTVPNIQWILDAPRLIMLAVNIILLIDIMRVLFTKLRRSENVHNLSTAKATLFLMPLFGVQFLITAWRPKTTSCDWEQAYYFFTYIMDGLQGVMVAMLYCYFNKEVHSLLKVTYRKTENIVSIRFRSDVRDRRATENNMVDRRQTFLTTLDNQVSRPFEVEGEVCRISATENRRTFTTFKPSKIDSAMKENEEANEIQQPYQDQTNVVTLLNNPYTPSKDGFIKMEFENDVYEARYDNLRRKSEEHIPNESNIIAKPRIPRNQYKPHNDYQNFEILTSCVKKNYDNGIDNESFDSNISKSETEDNKTCGIFQNKDLNNSESPGVLENHVIFLNRPLHRNILPDVCNVVALDENCNDNSSGKEKTPCEMADNDLLCHYDNLRYIASFEDMDELEVLDDIDPQSIMDEVQRNFDDHDYENLSAETQDENPKRDSDVIYDDIVFDPEKLCPNRRSDEEDIIFV